MSINTKSYPEGGNHLFPKKIVDSVEFRPVSLIRGVTSNTDFHSWAVEFIELVQGRRGFPIKKDGAPIDGVPTEYRRTVEIQHKDRAGRTVKTYVLHDAFPIEYKPASNFSADADDMLSMEKLVLAYESFEVVMPKEARESNPFSIKDVAKRVLRNIF